IRGIFAELADLIRQDLAWDAVPDSGGLHPITRYLMNYLRAASRSRKTLEQVFDEDYGNPLKEYPKIEDRMHCSNSSLSVQM
ncbi:exocyst complex component EXO70B1-like, partial [Trifolium medium]|nr:exocyst complex component EXO70B1-like [Trifolium medium]